ncbi:branched-chain amino acid ABC transporter permease, partial [Chloroflexota bacterium]
MLPGGIFSNKYASELKVFKTPTQWFLLLVVLLVFFLLVPHIASPYWLTKLIIIGIHIIVLLGLHILVGLTGLASLGQAGFMAIGSFTVAILASQWDINGWLCLPLSALAAGFVGIIVGAITVRLKLFYLAIATWASQEVILWLLRFPGPKGSDNAWWDYTGGFTGIQLEPLTLPLGPLGTIDFGSDTSLYILTVIFVVIGTYITLGIQRSNTGRILVAVRDNDLAAEVAG